MGLLPYLNTAESCRRWDDSIPEWLKPGVPVSVRFILETEDQGVAEQWEAGVVHSVDSEARVVSAAFATDKSSLYNVPFSDVREGLLRPSLVFQGVQDACSDPFFFEPAEGTAAGYEGAGGTASASEVRNRSSRGTFSMGEVWATKEEGVAFQVGQAAALGKAMNMPQAHN